MFSNPLHNVEQFHLMPGMHVADFGAGTGAYAIPVARMLGNGKVYAVEVQKDLIAKLKTAAQAAHATNIEYLWGDIERLGGTHIGDMAMDAVIAANILFQVRDKVGFASEVRRVLKKGGRVFLIDWKESFGGIGPAPREVVLEDQARHLFLDHGFVFEREIRGGDHHYGLIFKKA